jgi:hypothetical protein
MREARAKQIESGSTFFEIAHLISLQVAIPAATLTTRTFCGTISVSGNVTGNGHSPMTTPDTATASPSQRSRVTNGTGLLPGVDGRSALARRYRDLVAAITADLGGAASEALLLQVRNAASLQLHAEGLTARTVRGECIDPEAITRANGAANRALSAIRKSIGPKAKRARPAGSYGVESLDRHLGRPSETEGAAR